jgi:hypothetical protein
MVGHVLIVAADNGSTCRRVAVGDVAWWPRSPDEAILTGISYRHKLVFTTDNTATRRICSNNPVTTSIFFTSRATCTNVGLDELVCCATHAQKGARIAKVDKFVAELIKS